MSKVENRREQLDDALRRMVALLGTAEIEVPAETSDLGLARLVIAADSSGVATPRDVIALATRLLVQRLAEARPGRTVEVRVPPYAAVQVAHGNGPRHTRGTPPSVVETNPLTFLRLATGDLSWAEAARSGVRISGVHADLSDVFPF